MIIQRKRLNIILLDFAIWLFTVQFYLNSQKGINAPDNWAMYISIAAIGLLCLQLLQMKQLQISYRDFMFWYTILQYLFYYGRIILYWFDLDQYVSWHLFRHYSEGTVYKSALFALCFSQAMFIGMVWNQQEKVNTEADIEKKNRKYTGAGMAFAGVLVMLFSLPSVYSYSKSTILAQHAGSYIAVAETSGVTQTFYMAFFAGVLLLICSPRISRTTTNIVCVLYIIYGISYMILAADRRQMVITFIVMLLCYMRIYDIKLNVLRVTIFCIVAVIFLSLLSAISTVRVSGISLEAIVNNIKSQASGNNLIVEVLGEFGSTFFTIVNAMTHYPEDLPYVYGQTYLAAFLSLVPGVFTALFPKLFYAARITTNMKALDGNPCGGSLGQDMYANFASVGLVTTFIMGAVLGRLSKKYENPVPIDVCKYYIKFYILLNLVRAGFYEMTRTYIYILILVELSFVIYRQIEK